MLWVPLLILLVFFEAIADLFVKEWSIKNHWYLALLALAVYLLANVFWLFSMKFGAGLARGAVLFSILSAIVALVIGLIHYKEPINKIQLIALGFGFCSIVLFTIGEN